MKANDSQECRNYYYFEFLDSSAQKSVAANVHDKTEEAGQTCIDCHKDIAHKLPRNHDASREFQF